MQIWPLLNPLNSCDLPSNTGHGQHINLASVLLLSKLYILYLFLPPYSFSLETCVKAIANNHTEDSLLGYLEISVVKEMCPLLFSLTSHKFLGQRQKVVFFFFLPKFHKNGL